MVGIDKLFTVRVLTAIQVPAHLLGAAGDNIMQRPPMTGQHVLTEAVNIFWSVAAEYIRQLDHGSSKIVHQLIDGFCGHSFGFFSQMRVYTSCARAAVTQPGLDQTQVDAGFKKVRCP